MRSFILLGALCTLLPSASAAVVTSDDAVAFSVNRGRHVVRGAAREARDAEHFSNLRIRSAPEEIGSFDLAGTVDPGLVLSISKGTELPGGVTATGAIKANCASCFTTGSGLVTTDGVDFDQSAFINPFTAAKDFFKDPAKLIQDSFDVEMDFDLSNFTGHFEFDVDFVGSGVYVIPIPLPPTPLGGSFPNPPLPAPAPAATVGLVPTIDIIFAVTGAVSMTLGFEFNFPNNAFFKIDPIKGNLIETNFGDVQFNSLPLKVQSGSGTASASLRLGAKLAFDFNAFGQGFTLESGIFADVPTYSTSITFDPEASCELELTETLAVDAGVFALAAVTLEGINVALGPKSVTTFASLSLPGACLVTGTPAPEATTAVQNAIISGMPKAQNATISGMPKAQNVTISGMPKAQNSVISGMPQAQIWNTTATITAVAAAHAVPITYVPSSLATPILGAYIMGTPVTALAVMATSQ